MNIYIYFSVWFFSSYTEDCSGGGEFGLQSPTESLPSPVRPPLRHIDQYINPEIPNLSKRYTIAILTCIGKYELIFASETIIFNTYRILSGGVFLGFMISFGMRCNMSMAKLKFHIGSEVSVREIRRFILSTLR